MKHNPRLNEKMARLPGFADIHPLQPVSTVQGALELIDTLAHWLQDADRHAGGGDVAGRGRAWRAVRHDGDPRRARRARATPRPRVLVPESAHGTNPGDRRHLRLRGRSDRRQPRAAASISRR